jgi:hypothetical protein
MAEITETGMFVPLWQELKKLYGRYMPEEDVLDIKIIIRKYFTEKYTKREDLLFAESRSLKEGADEWAPDPGK